MRSTERYIKLTATIEVETIAVFVSTGVFAVMPYLDNYWKIGLISIIIILFARFASVIIDEEQINAMIQSQKALAEMAVSTGENWIGNLGNKELKDIFEMKGD